MPSLIAILKDRRRVEKGLPPKFVQEEEELEKLQPVCPRKPPEVPAPAKRESIRPKKPAAPPVDPRPQQTKKRPKQVKKPKIIRGPIECSECGGVVTAEMRHRAEVVTCSEECRKLRRNRLNREYYKISQENGTNSRPRKGIPRGRRPKRDDSLLG